MKTESAKSKWHINHFYHLHVKICIPNNNHLFDGTKEEKIFFLNLESYLLIYDKDYKLIIGKIKYENNYIKNDYFEISNYKLSEEISNFI
jgi:hypothetical protein